MYNFIFFKDSYFAQRSEIRTTAASVPFFHDNLEIVVFMYLLVEFMLWNGGESYFMAHCLFLPV